MAFDIKLLNNKFTAVRYKCVTFVGCNFNNKNIIGTMRVALIGYGQMGQTIERILLERGHKVTLVIDFNNQDDLCPEKMALADVAIEFTTPSTAFGNVSACLRCGVPVVCGTTGWHDKLREAERLCRELDGTLFYASNFSVGVNIFFAVNERLAQLMNTQPQYDVTMSETHHTRKKDAPSGTAVTLAEGIIDNIDRKSSWSMEKRPSHTLNITSIREGDVPGIHDIRYESTDDIIEIRHEAKSRNGFALGAILAAEYAAEHKGILTMKELLNL